MTDPLLLAAVVFGVNLLPAFGPPTWAVLVWFVVVRDIDPWLAVPLGALAAAGGRLTLAHGARRFRGRIGAERRDRLDAARTLLLERPRGGVAALGLFALSPVPSAQLFIAAGLLDVRLLPFAAAFFAGRIVSYSLYVATASVAADQLADVLGDALGSPLAIALQLVLLGGLVALLRVDWAAILSRRAAGGR